MPSPAVISDDDLMLLIIYARKAQDEYEANLIQQPNDAYWMERLAEARRAYAAAVEFRCARRFA